MFFNGAPINAGLFGAAIGKKLDILGGVQARLDDERSWIVLTESNRFAWPGPDIRPLDTETGYYGPIPPALFAEVKRRFVETARGGAHKSASRTT